MSLRAIYVCDDTHDEIMDNVFSGGILHYDGFILKEKVECSDDESECNENKFPYDKTVSA